MYLYDKVPTRDNMQVPIHLYYTHKVNIEIYMLAIYTECLANQIKPSDFIRTSSV